MDITRMIAMAAVVGVLLAWPMGSAEAQSAADKANAEQLFEEGRELMKQNRHAEACPKLEASNKLDPAVGTLLNLATCYEAIGKLAKAWGNFREAEDRARREGQQKRVTFARDRAADLEPRLPRLIIKAPAAEEIPGLEVKRDGTPVDPAQFGSKQIVDPGPITITASAPGYLTYQTEVTMEESKETVVEIPSLEEDPSASTSGSDLSGTTSATRPGSDDRRSTGSSRRLMGMIAGGAGVAFLAASGGFGLSAKSKWDEAFDGDPALCTADNICTPEGQSLTDSARSRANIATGLAIAGVAVVAAGTYLYLSAPSGNEKVARVVPSAGPDSLGLAVIGSF